MRRVLAALLLLLALSPSALAVDQDDANARADRNIRILLFSHHGMPAREVFERAVPDARARLLALVNDPAGNAVLKDRALIALAGFGGDDVRALYDRTLGDRAISVTARVHVLGAYARAFPVEARPVLERECSSQHAAVRSAANALIKASAAPVRSP